ncbi:hypothetical protein [Solilutibacter silvestris]|uniref:hypothetical protein n=1 Tax=Solilutibacter silvestris TaxID=1645665 RepID=UPI003D341163
MNFAKALLCLVFACAVSPSVSAQTQEFPPIVVTGPRAVNNNLTPQQFDAFAQLMSKPTPPPAVASIGSGDGSDSDCPAAKQAFKQSGCSLGGSESNPLNYNPSTYDPGSGLNRALTWSKDSLVYGPASDKFISTLLAYENKMNQTGGDPSDYGPFLLNGLADACVMQGANGAYNAPFFDCVGAVNVMASEVTAAIDQATKQGIIDKMTGAINKKTDGSGSVSLGTNAGPFSPGWSVNYQNSTNSLKVHQQLLLRESFCVALRTDVMLACGSST